MANIRVVRTLTYEGPEEWVKATVYDERRYVNGVRVVSSDSKTGKPLKVIVEVIHNVGEVE